MWGNMESIEKLYRIADDMRSLGASSLSPHELFCLWANEIEVAADNIKREVKCYTSLPVSNHTKSDPLLMTSSDEKSKIDPSRDMKIEYTENFSDSRKTLDVETRMTFDELCELYQLLTKVGT